MIQMVVWHLLLGKSTYPWVRFIVESIVLIQVGSVMMLISCFWLFVTWSASLPPRSLWWNLNLKMVMLLKLVWKFYWEPVPSTCQIVYLCICFQIMWNGNEVGFSCWFFPDGTLESGVNGKMKIGWHLIAMLWFISVFRYVLRWRM